MNEENEEEGLQNNGDSREKKKREDEKLRGCTKTVDQGRTGDGVGPAERAFFLPRKRPAAATGRHGLGPVVLPSRVLHSVSHGPKCDSNLHQHSSIADGLKKGRSASR